MIEAESGDALIHVADSALPDGMKSSEITMRAVPAGPLPDNLTPLTAYELGPDGAVFREPLPLDLCMVVPPRFEPGAWLVSDAGGEASSTELLSIAEMEHIGPAEADHGTLYRVRFLVFHFSIIKPYLYKRHFVALEYVIPDGHALHSVGEHCEIAARVSSPPAKWNFSGGGSYELSTRPGSWTFTGLWRVYGNAVIQQDTGRMLTPEPVTPIHKKHEEGGSRWASAWHHPPSRMNTMNGRQPQAIWGSPASAMRVSRVV